MPGVWGQAFFENGFVQLLLFLGMVYMGYVLLMHPSVPSNTQEHKERIAQLIAFFLVCIAFGFCQEANRQKQKMDRASSASDLLSDSVEEKKEFKND